MATRQSTSAKKRRVKSTDVVYDSLDDVRVVRVLEAGTA